MRVCFSLLDWMLNVTTDLNRIVEYATREQAQQAVNTLSNQNLMGRLVYVREVCANHPRFLESGSLETMRE